MFMRQSFHNLVCNISIRVFNDQDWSRMAKDCQLYSKKARGGLSRSKTVKDSRACQRRTIVIEILKDSQVVKNNQGRPSMIKSVQGVLGLPLIKTVLLSSWIYKICSNRPEVMSYTLCILCVCFNQFLRVPRCSRF